MTNGRAPLFSGHDADQARELRALAASRRAQEGGRQLPSSTRVIAVTSGKGGVGKTSLVVNVAVTLARKGKKVIILDCDLGTANVDVMLGMHTRYSLQHVLSRQRRLDEVMSVGPYGIQVISGGSGLQEMANLTDSRREELLTAFAALDGQADILLLDTGAGISANVLRFVHAAGEALVVTTPEPTAVTDAYALIKVVSQQAAGQPMRLRLIVNQATNDAEARETATNIVAVSKRFLGVDVEVVGCIPHDRTVSQAIRQQSPVVEAFPRSEAARAIEALAAQIVGQDHASGTADAEQITQSVGVRSSRPVTKVAPTSPLTPVAHGAGAVRSAQRGRGLGMFLQRMFGSPRGRAAS